MKPDDVVVQLKRNGSFDQLRKQLLTDFQNEVRILSADNGRLMVVLMQRNFLFSLKAKHF